MSAVKSRREQYSEATRAALLSAATQRFASHGFAGTALEDIAADVQATRGAVYHHFASKTALFQAVHEELQTSMLSKTVAASRGFADPRQAVLAALDVFLDHARDPVYGRIVWHEAPLALGWRRWRECELRYAYGLVERMVGTLMDSGDLPRLPLEPTARVTFHMLGAAGLALTEAPPDEKARVKAEYLEVIRRLLGGLRDGGPGRD
jgi:AcrR family transcriptional regulator